MSGVTRRLLAGLLGGLLALSSPPPRAAAVPDPGLGDSDGTVRALLVDDKGILYLGGSFSTVTGRNGVPIARNNLAAFNLVTGDVTSWNPDVDGPVKALAISPDGRILYVGGSFATVGGVSRRNLAAIDTTSDGTTPLAWAPDPDGGVRALALSGDGLTLYAGGAFATLAGGTVARSKLAAIDTASGVATPWAPQPDGAVEALLLSGDGASLYAGGSFHLIGAQPRPFLARLSLASGQADDWDPAPDNVVRALRQVGEVLYIGGDFTAVDGGAPGSRNFAAALDTTVTMVGAIALPWNPDFDGAVRALALAAGDAIIYAGGDFTTANGGVPRQRLAGLTIAAATLTAWNPGADQRVSALQTAADRETLYVGGDFATIGGAARTGLAAFAIGLPRTSAAPPGGGFQVPQTVSLSCLDNGGNPCAAIYFTSDGSQPQAIPAHLYSAPIAVPVNTSLRFFGVDGEGNTEAVRQADYFIDTTPPTVSASLPGGAYGGVTLRPVVLQCDDGADGAGCAAIHYTTDGTAPTTAATRYTVPIELDSLVPSGAGQVVLRFLAVDGAGNESSEARETYAIDVQPPVVTASLPDGTYAPPQTVTLNCDDGGGTGCAAIYYTLDGSVPSDGTIEDNDGNLIPPSSLYTGPLTFDSATMLNVLAVDKAGNKDTSLAGIYAFTVQRGRDNTAGALHPLAGLLMLLAWGWRRLSGGSDAWR